MLANENACTFSLSMSKRPKRFSLRSNVGCFACGIDLPLVFRERATNERGWEWNALGPTREMRSRGLADEQIIDELFLIEITAWEMLKGDSEALR